jgi:hypothetical protein
MQKQKTKTQKRTTTKKREKKNTKQKRQEHIAGKIQEHIAGTHRRNASPETNKNTSSEHIAGNEQPSNNRKTETTRTKTPDLAGTKADATNRRRTRT